LTFFSSAIRQKNSTNSQGVFSVFRAKTFTSGRVFEAHL
jgi:hypothetical protein